MADLYAVGIFIIVLAAMGFFAAWQLGCFDKK